MKFFKHKPKVSLDKFCRDFYNQNILYPIIADIFAKSRGAVVETEPAFASVDPQLFAAEMNALCIEVVSLALVHELGDEHLPAQSESTKRYLEEQGRLDIWDAMEPYNQAVVRSSILAQKWDSQYGHAKLNLSNSMRMQLCEEWYKQGFDPQCADRAANRLRTEEAWEKELTPGFLMLTLWERLDYQVKREAQPGMTAIITGLYSGAREAPRELEIEL